jgi:hypothetical protein
MVVLQMLLSGRTPTSRHARHVETEQMFMMGVHPLAAS